MFASNPFEGSPDYNGLQLAFFEKGGIVTAGKQILFC